MFFLPVDPRDEDHKDPENIDYSAPRLARYMHRHQDAVFWVDIDLGIKEGLVFYQTRPNAIILQGTLPAQCISKVERLKNGEVLYERRYLSPRPPPQISLKHDHDWTRGNDQLGSTVEHRPVGKLVQQSLGEPLQAESPKPTQSLNPISDRTEKLVTQEIVGKLQGELGSSDRTGEPVKDEDNRVMNVHDRTGKPVEASSHKVQEVGSLEHRDDADKFNLAIDDENIDFNISGVPNAMVKRSHSINVHNLIQQIENHPQRQALQSDLQQHRAFNPFSKESKDAIMAAGNPELCEIIDVEPKSQCRACLTYWNVGIVYCRCGHLLEDDTTENKKYIKSVLDLFSIPNFYIRKGRPHGHRYGKKEGDQEYHTSNQLQKRCRKKQHENIHDRFIRDKFFRKTMIELGRSEEVILEMDRLASEDPVILPQKKKWTSIVAIGGSVRIWWIPARCRQGVNLTSRKHCQHCTASRKRRTRNTMKIGRKVPPHGGNGTQLGGIPIMRIHHKDGVTTDRTGKLVYSVNQLFICGMNLSKNLMHNVS